MENKKEKTAFNPSVGADERQPIQKNAENSISEYEENIKSFEEMQREMQLSLDPSYLKAVSMNELFDTQYQSKPPLIDGLLYPGTYIFAGSPKLGKSFLMAQLAYHISTGTGRNCRGYGEEYPVGIKNQWGSVSCSGLCYAHDLEKSRCQRHRFTEA